MTLYALRTLIDDSENISLYNGKPVYVDDELYPNLKGRHIQREWLNRSHLDEELDGCLTCRYDECEVVAIWRGEDAICISVDAYIEVVARFRTELDGYEFDKEITYNKFDFDDDDDLEIQIDSDYEEWLDDLIADLRGYADKEVEGL